MDKLVLFLYFSVQMTSRILLTRFVFLGFFLLGPSMLWSEDIKTLAIGSSAPEFKLKGVDGKWYSLASFEHAEVLVIVFTCNHCPTAQAYEDRLIQLSSDYAAKNVSVIAINPNDPKSLRLDELDFSDIGDSYEEMKIRAREKNFNFPYLYDGDSQKISKAYGPNATPHAFVFDRERKCGTQDALMIWKVRLKNRGARTREMPSMRYWKAGQSRY